MALGTTGVQVLMTSVGTTESSSSKGKGWEVCKLCKLCTTEKPGVLSLHPDPLLSLLTLCLHVPLWQIRKGLVHDKGQNYSLGISIMLFSGALATG